MTRRVLLTALASVAGLCLWPRHLKGRRTTGDASCRCSECLLACAQERTEQRLSVMMRAEGLDPDRISATERNDYAADYVDRILHENRQLQREASRAR